MNCSLSGAMLSSFELLHEENYFFDKKNEIYKVTLGVPKSPRHLLDTAYDYNLVQRQSKKDACVPEKKPMISRQTRTERNLDAKNQNS